MSSNKERKRQLRAERLAREAEEEQRARRRRLVQLGSGAAFLAVCVVAVLIVVSQLGSSSGGDTSIEGASAVNSELKGVPQSATVLGDPAAAVTVTEFGDLQCPVCKGFSERVSTGLISGPVSDGDAKYKFKQWPILGDDSVTAAKAALAAGEQGRYWNFVDLFYRNQGFENSGYVTDDFLEAIAKGAGVPDIAKWNEDRDNADWDAALEETDAEAANRGLTGTPSILVSGPGDTVGFDSIPTLEQIEAAIREVQ